MVYQICLNLLSNASKYTASGQIIFSILLPTPEMRMQSGSEQPMWAVEVRDTGIGIAVHQRKLVFERFATLQVTHCCYPQWILAGF